MTGTKRRGRSRILAWGEWSFPHSADSRGIVEAPDARVDYPVLPLSSPIGSTGLQIAAGQLVVSGCVGRYRARDRVLLVGQLEADL